MRAKLIFMYIEPTDVRIWISKNLSLCRVLANRVTYMYACMYVCMYTYIHIYIYIYIYVTWTGGNCLICTHESEGAQFLKASADISGKSRLHFLHMLCDTSGTLRICRTCY